VREELYSEKNADSPHYTCGNMICLAQNLAKHLIVQLFRHDDNLHSTRRESSDMITRRFLKASTLIMRKNRYGCGTNANNKSLAKSGLTVRGVWQFDNKWK